MPNKRTIDLLTESYKDQMTARRKYEFKNKNSTYLLCKNAELEDGSKAFAPADAPNLQRELPESVLNEIELFMFDIQLNVDTAKK